MQGSILASKSKNKYSKLKDVKSVSIIIKKM